MWSGNPNISTLANNLIPPGNVDTYVNPYDAGDHLVIVGDWVRARPGVANVSAVKNALDALIDQAIIVPVWDEHEGQGSLANYRVSDFAQVRLADYDLSGHNLISVEFLGYVSCGETGVAPDDEAPTAAGVTPQPDGPANSAPSSIFLPLVLTYSAFGLRNRIFAKWVPAGCGF